MAVTNNNKSLDCTPILNKARQIENPENDAAYLLL